MTLAVLALHVAAVVWLTWPLAQVATSRLPATVGPCQFDTPLITWVLSHETHALATAPATLPQGNQYHPAPHALFYGPVALGALPIFAPVFLATGNPALAINVVLLGGAAITAWVLHLVVARATGSQLAGAVGAWTFLTTRWLFWTLVPTNPFYACLAPFPLIVAEAARPDVRVRRLLPLVVLQALSDVAYVAAAVLAPLGVIGIARATRRSSRAAGLRTLATVAAAPLVLAPVYAGYAIVAAENPSIGTQTNWRGLGSTLYPWLGEHLTALPWGPIGDLAPTALAPVAFLLVVVGLLVVALRGESVEPAARLWRHALAWTVVGFLASLTPSVEWNGRAIALPQASIADWSVLHVIREPSRLAIAALFGVSMLTGLAFARLTRGWPRAMRVLAGALVLVVTYVQYARGFTMPFARRPLPASYPTAAAPAPPDLVRALRDGTGPVLELPVGPDGGVMPFFHAGPLYRSIYHWRPLLNGYAGYWPAGFSERMALARRLPDADALAELVRQTGLRTVVVNTALRVEEDARGAWEALAVAGGRDDLRFVARIGDHLVFAVEPSGASAAAPTGARTPAR